MDESQLNSKFKHALADMLYRQQRYRIAASYYIDVYNNAQKVDKGFDKYYQSYSGLSNAGISYNESEMHDRAQICFNKTST